MQFLVYNPLPNSFKYECSFAVLCTWEKLFLLKENHFYKILWFRTVFFFFFLGVKFHQNVKENWESGPPCKGFFGNFFANVVKKI